MKRLSLMVVLVIAVVVALYVPMAQAEQKPLVTNDSGSILTDRLPVLPENNVVQQSVVTSTESITPTVMYMQMGGDPGIASVLARTNGAKAAAAALGIELHEQYSSWDQQKMIDAFKEAIAANPDWRRSLP